MNKKRKLKKRKLNDMTKDTLKNDKDTLKNNKTS